jgi:cullin-4
MDKEQDDKMVSRLIALRQSALAIVKKCFNEDTDFRQNVSQAFEFFINKRENKPAEMMGELAGLRGIEQSSR